MLKIAVMFLLINSNFAGIATCSSRSDRWLTNTTVRDVEYYVSKDMMSFPECTSFCNQLGSCAHIAEYFRIVTTSEFADAMCLLLVNVWIQKIQKESRCYVLFNRTVTQTLPCASASSSRCLCQRQVKTSTITYGETFVGDNTLCLDYQKISSDDSTLACKYKWNGTVVSYSDPLQYLQLPKVLKLRKDYQYWLQDDAAELRNTCLTLSVTEQRSFLQETDCSQRFYSICSKHTNLTADMSSSYSFNAQKTLKAASKLTSAMDSRTLSVIIGGIGVSVDVVFVALIVAMDLGNLVKTCKDKQCCKRTIAKTRVQPLHISEL